MPRCDQCDANVPAGAAFCPVCRWPTSQEIISQAPERSSSENPAREALAALQEGDTVRARELFEEAVSDDPDNPLLHFQLGQVYYELGSVEMALRELRMAEDLDPDNPKYQAWIRKAQGAVDEF